MHTWNSTTYGTRWAEVYDRQPWPDAGPAVEFLAGLADGGPALELAIGTGRVALPLIARGVAVHGVDSSAGMVDKMRRKPGGQEVPVLFADIADFTTETSYPLAFLVLNTLYGLETQEEQIACFRCAARALRPGGRFVVEGFVPDPARFTHGSRVQVYDVGLDHVTFEADVHDLAAQRVFEQHVTMGAQGIETHPAFLRYVWPSELDLMARLAGFEPVARFGGWSREPFSSHSVNNVSVYRLART